MITSLYLVVFADLSVVIVLINMLLLDFVSLLLYLKEWPIYLGLSGGIYSFGPERKTH